MKTLDNFLLDLIKATGQTDPILIEETIEELEPQLYDRLIVSLITQLSPTDQQHIQKYIETDDLETLLEQIEKKLPNIDDKVAKIIEQFADEYLQHMK